MFAPQTYIQGEYYQSCQVSILMEILYRHVEHGIDGFNSNANNCEVIKECYFYISYDHTRDTYFVQNCFNIIYKDLLEWHITFKEHCVWLDGCASQFKWSQPFI